MQLQSLLNVGFRGDHVIASHLRRASVNYATLFHFTGVT